MRVGTIISLPNAYSEYARIRQDNGMAHTVDKGELPKNAAEGDQFAYKVDIYGNDSGLAYNLKDT